MGTWAWATLRADLADQAKASPYLGKYDNTQATGVKAGATLANSNLKDAFEKEQPAAAPGAEAAAQPDGEIELRALRQHHLRAKT